MAWFEFTYATALPAQLHVPSGPSGPFRRRMHAPGRRPPAGTVFLQIVPPGFSGQEVGEKESQFPLLIVISTSVPAASGVVPRLQIGKPSVAPSSHEGPMVRSTPA